VKDFTLHNLLVYLKKQALDFILVSQFSVIGERSRKVGAADLDVAQGVEQQATGQGTALEFRLAAATADSRFGFHRSTRIKQTVVHSSNHDHRRYHTFRVCD